MKKIAIIMAGGLGVRLWPRSREKHPKQFISVMEKCSPLLQNTYARLHPLFNTDDIYIVCNSNAIDYIRNLIPHLPIENIITEPFGRNTVACVCLASTILQNKYKEDIITCFFPSDHIISNVTSFQQTIDIACNAALQEDVVMTVGVHPTRPETGLGYIQVSEEEKHVEKNEYKAGVRKVSTFAEKPDVETAQRFVNSGDFLWNTGVFIWSLSTFTRLFDRYLQDYSPMFRLLEKHLHADDYDTVLENVYRQIRPTSVDYAILEKIPNKFVVEGLFDWSDVGSWDEVFNLKMKDEHNNVHEGEVIAVDSENCLVMGRDKMISLVGVDDLIVVDSDDALLICKRSESQDVKEIINFMRRKGIDQYL